MTLYEFKVITVESCNVVSKVVSTNKVSRINFCYMAGHILRSCIQISFVINLFMFIGN